MITVFLALHAPGFEMGAVAVNAQDSMSGFQRGHPLNTIGNRNRDIDEPVGLGQRLMIGLLRLAVPPHADDESWRRWQGQMPVIYNKTHA